MCTGARCRTGGRRGAPRRRASAAPGGIWAPRSRGLAELESRDAADLDVLARRPRELRDEVADRLGLVLDVRLMHEHRRGLRGLLVTVLREQGLDLLVLQELPPHVLPRHPAHLPRPP